MIICASCGDKVYPTSAGQVNLSCQADLDRIKELEDGNTYLLRIIESDTVSIKALRDSNRALELDNMTLRNALQIHGEEAAQLASIRDELKRDDRRVLNKVASECDDK